YQTPEGDCVTKLTSYVASAGGVYVAPSSVVGSRVFDNDFRSTSKRLHAGTPLIVLKISLTLELSSYVSKIHNSEVVTVVSDLFVMVMVASETSAYTELRN